MAYVWERHREGFPSLLFQAQRPCSGYLRLQPLFCLPRSDEVKAASRTSLRLDHTASLDNVAPVTARSLPFLRPPSAGCFGCVKTSFFRQRFLRVRFAGAALASLT